MADGGEGTVQSLVDATNGQIVHAEVTGPDGKIRWMLYLEYLEIIKLQL